MDYEFVVTEGMTDAYGSGWRNENDRVAESGEAGVGGARRTAGILALVENPEFQAAMKDYLKVNADPDNEMDRSARAYGWEIGRGKALAREVETSDDNPFLNRDWRDVIYK